MDNGLHELRLSKPRAHNNDENEWKKNVLIGLKLVGKPHDNPRRNGKLHIEGIKIPLLR